MRVAFYAPLKPPDHPVASGDRRIARALIAALARGGHEVELISRFRAFDGAGNGARLQRLGALGGGLARRIVRCYRALPAAKRPEAVFTYHVYDKAPDWIGPAVARALGVPYLICEASLNAARAQGGLAVGFAAARAAVATADAIVELNPTDREAVAAALGPGAAIFELAPFLEGEIGERPCDRDGLRRALAREHGLDPAPPWLLSVAMMREGDKLASFRVLADALALLRERPWQLAIAGDGEARGKVEAAFRPLGEDRVRFLGEREGAQLAALYAAADIHAWPAVNEALGMAVLEAQAAGLPAVVGAHGALGRIVADGVTGAVVPEGDAAAFARALGALLDDPARTAATGAAARENVRRRHGIDAAARVLDEALAGAAARARGRAHDEAVAHEPADPSPAVGRKRHVAENTP